LLFIIFKTRTIYANDAARLIIDGKAIVDNRVADTEVSGGADLKACDHDIKVEFYQNGGAYALIISWQTDGIPKEVIPKEAFFH
jgi:hypothetical protein